MSKRGNGEGSIYQRESDKRWVGSVHLGYDGGKRKRKTVYGDTRKEVAEKLKRLLRDQQQHLPIATPERLSVARYLEGWLKDTVRPSVRPSTFESYRAYCVHHLIPDLGRTRLTALTPQDVERFTAQMVTKGKSARTAHHARAILRKAIADGVRSGLLARNVAAIASPPRVAKKEPASFTPEQARQFLEGIKGSRDEALYTVALACGLRMGEITGLTWADIDSEEGTIRVRQALQRAQGEFRRVEPKSSTSRRTIGLPVVAREALREHRVRQLEERLAAGSEWDNELDLVFTTSAGRPLNPSSLNRRFRGVLTRLKLPQMRFHDLRHSCASLLIAKGVHPRIIMETLGHSQISLTMNTYAHVMPVVQREATVQMDAVFASASS